MTKQTTQQKAKGNIILASVVLLSGCGSSTAKNEVSMFQEVDIFERVSGLEAVDPTTIPVTGTASYSGAVAMDFDLLGEVVGVLDVDIDFSSKTDFVNGGVTTDFITGGVSDITTVNGQDLDGILVLTDGVIVRFPASLRYPKFLSSVDGDLVLDDDTYTVNGTLEGEFYGEDRVAIRGAIGGNVVLNDGFELTYFEGVYAAEHKSQ